MTASDLGYVAALNDAIEQMQKLFHSADRMKGCHYTAMGSADTTERYRDNRVQYEFYEGKCDAYGEALKALKDNRKSINKEYGL